MKKEIKSLFRDRIIVFIISVIIVMQIILLLVNYKSSEDRYDVHASTISQTWSQFYDQRSRLRNKAKLQDSSPDKEQYKNYTIYQDSLDRKNLEILDRVSRGEEVDEREFLEAEILNIVNLTHVWSQKGNEDRPGVLDLYPEKFNRFLESINPAYNFEALSYIKGDDPSEKGYFLNNYRLIEYSLDSYNKGKLEILGDYNIYSHLRDMFFRELGV